MKIKNKTFKCSKNTYGQHFIRSNKQNNVTIYFCKTMPMPNFFVECYQSNKKDNTDKWNRDNVHRKKN